jgi:nucleotide-binding universal stress UspA family protein
MKTIIIPTDFTPGCFNALHYGIELARTTGAGIMLFHAYQVPANAAETSIIVLSVEDLESDAKKKMAKLLEQTKHISFPDLEISSEIRLGEPSHELKSLCKTITPFAVVLSSRSASPGHTFYGSTTVQIIKNLTVPVITIPPGINYGHGIKKIGLACDFKDVKESTPAETIRSFVKIFGASLHVMNVAQQKEDAERTTTERELLHTLLEDLNPEYHSLKHEDVEDGINEFAEKNNFDLLIVIPKKHSLLEGIFRSSSTRQFVYQSHIPVMCIHND